MNRRSLLGAAFGASVPVFPPQNPMAAPLPGFTCVDTIADLELVIPQALHNDQFVFVKGFDAPGDGCGGLFYWLPSNLWPSLRGVAFNSLVAGSWHRHREGPVHTRWAGIKPTGTPDVFDAEGIGAQNRQRWSALNGFCQRQTWELVAPDVSNTVADTIFVDAGIHDFSGGTLHLGQGVGLQGCGPGRSVLRSNDDDGNFLEVGDDGDADADHKLYSSFDVVKDLSIVHYFEPQGSGSTGTDVGIAFFNTVRRCGMRNVHVQGFGTNVHLDAFGMNVESCYFESGYRRNLRIGPLGNSMTIVGCRIDAQRWTDGGESILVDNLPGGARSILFLRCDIQRAQRVAFRCRQVASLAIRDCFFEGNDRTNGSHPDIWIEGDRVRNVVVDGCYFTGTGRWGATSSRAINIRSDVTEEARIQVTNNEQADNPSGIFAYFIDIDTSEPLELVSFNNIQDAPNSIPESVIVKTVTTV